MSKETGDPIKESGWPKVPAGFYFAYPVCQNCYHQIPCGISKGVPEKGSACLGGGVMCKQIARFHFLFVVEGIDEK